MAEAIAVGAQGADLLPWETLRNFQGELKKISSRNLERFKKQIVSNGFSAPILVWKKNGKTPYILDGHQRIKALQALKADGWSVPEKIPVDYVKAKTLAEAKRKLLGFVSVYGEVNKEGLESFMFDLDYDQVKEETNINKIDMVGVIEEAGQVPFATELLESHNYVVLTFDNDVDWLQAQTVLELKSVRSKNPRLKQVGIGRVLPGAPIIKRLA